MEQQRTAMAKNWFVVVGSPEEFEEAKEHFKRTLEEAQLSGEEVKIRVMRVKKIALCGAKSSKGSHG